MRTRKLLVLFAVMALVVLTAISFAQTTKLKRIGLYTFVEVKGDVEYPPHMWLGRTRGPAPEGARR